MVELSAPSEMTDSIDAQILAISGDRVQGFVVEPFAEIARLAGLPESLVIERLSAMLETGVIGRIGQALKATNLAQGALVAWQVPPDCLEFAFTYLAKDDPFTGQAVIRSTDGDSPGSKYCLWTTLEVPPGFSLAKHCDFLEEQVGAVAYKVMPALRLFAPAAGQVPREDAEPGSRSEEEGRVIGVNVIELSDLDWRVLTALRREFTVEEIHSDPWRIRARDAGESLDEFVRCAHSLAARGVIGGFSTSPRQAGQPGAAARAKRCNALFHWRVPEGREIDAGKEVARHHVISETYWREAGPEFGNVNILAVGNAADKELVLEHKFLIDEHIREAGIPILYTNTFWGGRSEIKQSETSPVEYASWCRRVGCNPREMRSSPAGD